MREQNCNFLWKKIICTKQNKTHTSENDENNKPDWSFSNKERKIENIHHNTEATENKQKINDNIFDFNSASKSSNLSDSNANSFNVYNSSLRLVNYLKFRF